VRDEGTKLDRILRALGHPIRRRILRALADQAGSASSLASEFGLELPVVSYHLNRVLAGECDAVTLIETVPRRGSIEKIYRLNAELWTDLAAVAEGSNRPRRTLRMLSPGECFLEAVEAMGADTFAQLDGSAWEWFPVAVDSRAWKAIQAAKKDFNQRVETAVEEGRERKKRRRSETYDVVVGVAAFPAAPPPGRP
jgi:DNA-binding transcriptional ArsR family regulator